MPTHDSGLRHNSQGSHRIWAEEGHVRQVREDGRMVDAGDGLLSTGACTSPAHPGGCIYPLFHTPQRGCWAEGKVEAVMAAAVAGAAATAYADTLSEQGGRSRAGRSGLAVTEPAQHAG
eukprot:gene2238-biopygen6924